MSPNEKKAYEDAIYAMGAVLAELVPGYENAMKTLMDQRVDGAFKAAGSDAQARNEQIAHLTAVRRLVLPRQRSGGGDGGQI